MLRQYQQTEGTRNQKDKDQEKTKKQIQRNKTKSGAKKPKNTKHTHTHNTDILYSDKGRDVEISSSNTPPHNYINNLKCVE